MRQRIALGVSLVLLATAGGLVPLSLSSGQPPATDANPIKPAVYTSPAGPAAPVTPVSANSQPDLRRMPEGLRRTYVSARSGAEWLIRVENPINGRFNPGWLPALNMPLDQDSFLNQAEATYALAKAARFYGDDRYLMKARQAILSLLADTQSDPADPSSRYTKLPTMAVNRLAAAGLLVLAIHELQAPAEDLLKQGEELCQFVRKQQQADGSLRITAAGEEAGVDVEAAQTYPGLALYGVMLSARNRPASWKLEMAARALPYYRQQWSGGPSAALAASLTPAFAEAFVQTRERKYADFIFEMSDWTCALQYGADASHPKWVGGFKRWEHGNPVLAPPTVAAGRNIEALALACLATRHIPDASRYARYRDAADLGSQFLIGLQYTESNTLHFAPAYRPALIGGFHTSHQDGNLRLDQNRAAMVAMLQRLICVGDQ